MSGTVHIVDDDASFRTAIKRRLDKAGYKALTYTTVQQLLDQGSGDCGPCCILVDVSMLGISGLDLQHRTNELYGMGPTIFVTRYPELRTIVRTIKAGATDFLAKPVKPNDLLSAIEKALAQHSRLRELNSARDALRARFQALTPRERQVFELVVRGNINKQIAHQLGTAERTIKAHRHRVMEKMLAQSVPELVSTAARLGCLPDPVLDQPIKPFVNKEVRVSIRCVSERAQP